MIEHCAFYDDGEDIASHAGWYFINCQGIVIGPFYTRHQAQSAADEDWNYEGC